MDETPSLKTRVPMRKIIPWVVGAMGVAFVVFSITEIESIIAAVKTGNMAFLLLAFALEFVVLINNAANYWTLYRLVGLEESLRRVFMLSTSSSFINMIAPSGGIGGMAVFIDTARQRGYSPAKVMVVGILYVIYEYLSLLFVVALGFVALIHRGNLTTGEIIAAVILLFFTIAFTLVLYFGYRSTKQLGEFLFKAANWINDRLRKMLHRDLIQAEKAHILASDIAEGVTALRGKKKGLVAPMLYALSNKALLIGLLTTIFLALKVPFSSGTIVAGYSISQLFFYISPTPAGVGFVEGIFPVTLKALLVPFAQAVLITLIYRGITVWLAFIVGFLSFQRLQREHLQSSSPEQNQG
jgi:uncharacterized protein (TIRG00374 family)